MAKSIRVRQVGQRQTFSLNDPEEVHYAQKAINTRIQDIAKSFGTDSQIYKDYIAPLINEADSRFIRLNKEGVTMLKTGKATWDTEEARAIVERMLQKATKGEILRRTAEQFGGAVNLQHQKAIMKTPGKVKPEIIKQTDLKQMAEEFHTIEMSIYSRLQEIYDIGENNNITEEERQKIMSEKFDWYDKLRDAHGKPNAQLIAEINASLTETSDEDFIKMFTLEKF